MNGAPSGDGRHTVSCRFTRYGMSGHPKLSRRMPMATASFMETRSSVSHRLIAGIASFVLLGSFFAVPLYAALTICAMPCCGHGDDDGGTTLVSAGMAACATECAFRSDEATSTAAPSVAPETGAARGVPLLTVVASAPERPAIAALAEEHTPGFLRGSDASLQILNSTFRI